LARWSSSPGFGFSGLAAKHAMPSRHTS